MLLDQQPVLPLHWIQGACVIMHDALSWNLNVSDIDARCLRKHVQCSQFRLPNLWHGWQHELYRLSVPVALQQLSAAVSTAARKLCRYATLPSAVLTSVKSLCNAM